MKNKKQIFAVIVSVLIVAFSVTIITKAVTTVGNDVSVGGDLTVTGTSTLASTLYVNQANNRVGIGTASPTEFLHIQNSASSTIMVETTTQTNEASLHLRSSGHDWEIATQKNPSASSGLKFRIEGVEVLRILTTYKVGIGTTTPSFLLTTAGTQYTTGATYLGSTLNVQATSTLSSLIVSGNVGIGTTTPAYNLEVSSSASTTVMIGSGALTGCLGIGDIDKAGITWCTALDGTLTCTSAKPQQCK
ncbi:MAG: hypothetical protein V1819_00360 [bacterium]